MDRAKAEADTLACWQAAMPESTPTMAEFGIGVAGAVVGGAAGAAIAGGIYDAVNRDEVLARQRRFMGAVETCMVSRGYPRKSTDENGGR